MIPTLFRRRPRVESALAPISRDVDQMFDEFMDWWRGNGWPVSEETASYPVDIREENGNILVDAELPGFRKDEIEVSIEQGLLSINAEHKEEKEEKGKGKTYLQERRYRRVQRSFTLPTPVDESKVEANLKDGVLQLRIPKSKEAVSHKVAIK